MKCPHCGHDCAFDASFCPKCGKRNPIWSMFAVLACVLIGLPCCAGCCFGAWRWLN